MNTIDASHLEVIRQHLLNNHEHEFKMRKYRNQWYMVIQNIFDEPSSYYAEASGDSFAKCVEQMSKLLAGEQRNGSNT